MVGCASCGTANPDGFRFCGACAAPLTAAVTSAREERRTVTVLFADLAGFTARSETLDPEDVRAFLLPYYDVLTSEVERHGGHVDRFLGDGVMALFGAPAAHEDDPERAVRAALAILERVGALGLDLHVRIGVNTGEILFAAGGPGRDDAVAGDAVNTAARLQAAAPVDGVVVGEATQGLTARVIAYEALPPVSAKGKAAPLALWRATGTIARRAGELAAEATPFIGRDLELASLARLLERARTTPSLEVVTIVADPGLGKSRLVRELARHVEALPDLVTWRVGRCLPYGDGISFWALGEIVKAHAGILDTDDQATRGAKLDAVLVEPDPSLRTWMRDRVGPLAGLVVTSEPPTQEEAFAAWRRFLGTLATARPTVLVFEDLHWADDALVTFLLHFAERTAGLPLLVVATARPEVEDRHPAWLGRARRHTVLSLAALTDAEMAVLIESTLRDSSPGFISAILERAAGSPLYAEQLAAMLRDRPPIAGGSHDAEAIPPSVAALLAARIDALPPEAKAILLDASVVGKTFWSGAVAAISGQDHSTVDALLAELTRRDLVRPVFPSSVAGEAQFAFWHALLRDVAYGKLPRASRLARHAATAAWITERAGTARGEEAEIVVAHLERALALAEASRATGEVPGLTERLLEALLLAAEQAMRTDVPRAIGHLRRALRLLGPADPRRPENQARLGRALIATDDLAEGASMLEEAAASLQSRGELLAAAELVVPLTPALVNSGQAGRANSALAEARVALETRPGPGLVAVIAEQAVSALVAGRYDLARSLANESVGLSEQLGLPPSQRALMARGAARLGVDPEGGEADLRLACERAEAEGDVRSAATALVNLAATLLDVRGPVASLAVADEAAAFCAARGLPTEYGRQARVAAIQAAGRWDEVVEEAGALRAWASERGDASVRVSMDGHLSAVRIERGELTGSLDGLVAAGIEVGWPPVTFAHVEAEADLARGDAEAARCVLEGALDATPEGEMSEVVSIVRASLRAGSPALARRALAREGLPGAVVVAGVVAAQAMVSEAVGEARSAADGYADAVARWAEFGMVPEEAYALAGLGRCLLLLGETEEGIERLREARAIWERLRATPRIAEIDESLATVT